MVTISDIAIKGIGIFNLGDKSTVETLLQRLVISHQLLKLVGLAQQAVIGEFEGRQHMA